VKYLSLKSYSDTGETASTVEMILPSKEGSRSQFTGTFTTRLGRPNYYRIEYQQKVSDYQTDRVNVWSAGKGDFLWMTGMETPKQENDRDTVLAMAGPNSSGVAGNLIKLFFNISTNLVDTFQQVRIEKDEQIEGDECYVLAGRHTGGGTQTLWISKKTFFIRKVKNVSEPSKQSPSFEDMARQSFKKNNQDVTPEAIHQFISRMVGDILKARNEEPTAEAIEREIKKMGAINKTAMEMLKNQRFSTTIIYRNIQVDTPIVPNQFQPDSLDAGLNKPAVSQPAAGSAKCTAVVTGIVESMDTPAKPLAGAIVRAMNAHYPRKLQ
jgi:outer membrane lipoprotein-sorting protein